MIGIVALSNNRGESVSYTLILLICSFRSFNLTIKHFHPDLKPDVKLSSAGLIYAHFGKRVIGEIIGKPDGANENPDVAILFAQIYSSFVSEVDAIDNGVHIAPVAPT